jgi:hypothetical protein
MEKSAKLLFLLWIMLVPMTVMANPVDRSHGMPYEIVPIRNIQYMSIVAEWNKDKMLTKIEPFNSPRLDRFTRVIWTNNTDIPVRIKLGKGSKCQEASETQLLVLDWRLDRGCYITQKPILPKGALETTFTEQGKYPYEVEFVGKKVKESGVITIY